MRTAMVRPCSSLSRWNVPSTISPRLGVEVARRFVGKNERGVVDERARDRDALDLASGKFVRLVFKMCFVHAGRYERRGGAFFALCFIHTCINEWQHDITKHARARQEVERLEHEPDLILADIGELFVGKLRNVFTVQKIFSGGRPCRDSRGCASSWTCRNPRVP